MKRALASWLAMAIFASAFASADEAPATAAADAPVAAEAAAPSRLAKGQVPKLVIRWDCGDCEMNVKVAPLIEELYAQEAAARGFTVSSSETADAAIVDFRQRSPGMRVMFGIMAGKDRLTLKVTFRGSDFRTSDNSGSAISGVNALCQTVARQAATHLIAVISTQ